MDYAKSSSIMYSVHKGKLEVETTQLSQPHYIQNQTITNLNPNGYTYSFIFPFRPFTKESTRDIMSKKLMSFPRKYLWVKW